MKSKKVGNILKIKHFSDSENDDYDDELEVEDEMEEDQNEQSEELENENIEEEDEQPTTSKKSLKKVVKKRKKGIIYIGTIPKHMNVSICREFMERFGEVGRIFLQPDKKGSE